MKKHSIRNAILNIFLPAALILGFSIGIQGQRQSSSTTGATATGTLVVDSDDTCRLTLDGTDEGVITPNGAKTIRVNFGQHVLKCSVENIPDLVWRKVIEVKSTEQVAAVISLRALHIQFEEAVEKLNKSKSQPIAAKERAPDARISPEQQQKTMPAQQQNQIIKGLNAQLAEAQQLEAAGNYDQAISILQPAAQANPNQDVLWANLGEAQRAANKYPDAIDSYQKAIALKPTNGPYHSALADALAKSGQTDKAVAEWATAVQNDPTNAGAYYFNEGAVLTNTGKVDEAIAAFDKALQADPKRADAYYWKGIDLMGKATVKGDKMIAPAGTAEAFNKYLELEPNGKYADPAKQMLASIGAPR
jgi:tetratricopeptide (TPR) repeat protein